MQNVLGQENTLRKIINTFWTKQLQVFLWNPKQQGPLKLWYTTTSLQGVTIWIWMQHDPPKHRYHITRYENPEDHDLNLCLLLQGVRSRTTARQHYVDSGHLDLLVLSDRIFWNKTKKRHFILARSELEMLR